MKNKVFYILFLASLPLFAPAQEYVSFPTKNTIWAENYFSGDGYPYCSFFYFALKDNDTIINEHQYHKLYFSCDTNFTEDEFCGALREENKKVFYYSINPLTCIHEPVPVNKEIIIYDFNLKLGDTITSDNYRVGYPDYITVSKIDSIQINNEYRKVFSFGYDGYTINDAKWIEGIGCIRGLLADLGYIGGWTNRLMCCITDHYVIYHHTYEQSDDCYNLSSVNLQLLENKSGIKATPNPAGSKLKVDFGDNNYQRLILSDLSGRPVRQYLVDGLKTLTIEREGLTKGIYLLSAFDRAGSLQTLKILLK